DLRALDRDAVQPGDAAAQHRHRLDPDAGHRRNCGEKAGELTGLDVDDEIGRGALGEAGVDRGGEVAFDQRHRGEYAEPDAERHDRAPGRPRLASARRRIGRAAIRRTRASRRAAAATAPPSRRKAAKAAAMPATYHSAVARSAAVATTRPASPTAASAVAATAAGAGRRGAGAIASRNSAPGTIRPTAASGISEKASVASNPAAAASARASG